MRGGSQQARERGREQGACATDHGAFLRTWLPYRLSQTAGGVKSSDLPKACRQAGMARFDAGATRF
jgi:hypothetical protein